MLRLMKITFLEASADNARHDNMPFKDKADEVADNRRFSHIDSTLALRKVAEPLWAKLRRSSEAALIPPLA